MTQNYFQNEFESEEFLAISSFFRLFSGHTFTFWNTKHKSEQHNWMYKFYKFTLDDFVL